MDCSTPTRSGDGTESDLSPDNRDGFSVSGGSGSTQDIIIDHNSIEWGVDENVDIWKDVSKLTFSNNIVAEGLRDSIDPDGPAGTGMLIASGGSGIAAHEISIVNNLFAFNYQQINRVTL